MLCEKVWEDDVLWWLNSRSGVLVSLCVVVTGEEDKQKNFNNSTSYVESRRSEMETNGK